MHRLADACKEDVHEFWSDEISLLNPEVVDSTRIHGHGSLPTSIFSPLPLRTRQGSSRSTPAFLSRQFERRR
jgi:hypothetical protein